MQNLHHDSDWLNDEQSYGKKVLDERFYVHDLQLQNVLSDQCSTCLFHTQNTVCMLHLNNLSVN